MPLSEPFPNSRHEADRATLRVTPAGGTPETDPGRGGEFILAGGIVLATILFFFPISYDTRCIHIDQDCIPVHGRVTLAGPTWAPDLALATRLGELDLDRPGRVQIRPRSDGGYFLDWKPPSGSP